MSSVKALPLGHATSPMYVVMDRPPSHEVSAAQYKRLQPPVHQTSPATGPRAYPAVYPPTSSPHMGPHYGHVYREAASHFQVDGRPPSMDNHVDRYGEQHHARRRLSLRPAPDYNATMEKERYMEAIRYQYERDVAIYSSNTLAARGLKPPVVSVHTPPSEMDHSQPIKRPRLAVEPKAPVHQQLLIDTRSVVIKKEPSYTPQVEAISPTLPSEEGRCDSPFRPQVLLQQQLDKLDKDILQEESHISRLERRLLEMEKRREENEGKDASKCNDEEADSPSVVNSNTLEEIIYSTNMKLAKKAQAMLDKFGSSTEVPIYNQPCDTAVYHENKRRFMCYRSRLMKFLKKRQKERSLRETHLTQHYNKLLKDWHKKMEKRDGYASKKAKESKTREFYEKQFPELKKQREDKERISRVSTRIRSESEWEEIIDGLQEQEMEEKKMRSYAVIPPIVMDPRKRNLIFDDQNGLVTDFADVLKDPKKIDRVWTQREKDIFKERFLLHPKNFTVIASYLDRKTVPDCIEYYYLSKKKENYKSMLKRHNVRKRTRALVKGHQAQQAQINQASGVITRQQEDSKLLISSCSKSLTSNTETTTQASTSEVAPPNSSSDAAMEPSATPCSQLPQPMETDTEASVTPSKQDPSKILLPNNIRKKKEAAQMLERQKGEDSDNASDPHSGNSPSQPCAICKLTIDNFNQSRPLTKFNCGMFGLKEGDLNEEMRVCASCRFKSVRKRCPIPTCKTPKRKVKRLRPLPVKLAELPKEAKDAIIAEFQIPADVNKCCSACFNRIVRKFENSELDSDTLKWTDEEKELAKQGLRQHGSDWDAVSTVVGAKNREQCKTFYFNYRRKFGLEDILKEFKKSKGEDDKTPPTLTDEEESGETTSSCDEDDCADRCSSDTASAPSHVDKDIVQDKNASQGIRMGTSEPSQLKANLLNHDDSRPRLAPHYNASPKCLPDYDSSATASAAEDEDQNDDMSSPHIVHQSGHLKMGIVNEHPKKAFQCPYPKDADHKYSETSVPLVKTLLQDPKIGAAQHDNAFGCKPTEKPTFVRDLIHQAVEKSFQHPEPSRNSPLPSTFPAIFTSLTPELYPAKSKKESDSLIPPAHSRQSSRPPSHSMEMPMDCEVQDLSKKVKSRDASPVKDFQKKERNDMTPVRPPSGSSASALYYGAPPPAHSNQYRSNQPPAPPSLSPHYVAETHHDSYYARGGKSYLAPERPLSQPPHLVAQSPSLANSQAMQTLAKSGPVKSSVPPVPPLVASKPSQMSPKLPFKDRGSAPAGSITQGTPVNQQPVPIPPTAARYEAFLRLPQQSKDGGSIIHGTPVPHDIIKRVPNSRPEAYAQNYPDNHLVRQAVPAMYDPNVMEYYRQVAPGSQQYAYPPGYPPYPQNVPQRPPYSNESQMSTKQIVIDYNTSKQMLPQVRKGSTGSEKEVKVSPKGTESHTNQSSENHLHPMYPPANYQGGGPHFNHVPPGYQTGDPRYMHHRSPSSQIDRTRSPSGVESPMSGGYPPHPGKRSPSLSVSSASRQNVIHRSITWGTGKPSVIQAPQSASPRTLEVKSESGSPAGVRKSTPSPRHPQPMMYPGSGHDAFNTLVNAAVAQPSLAVPKDGKGSPNSASLSEMKSPRDRPVVEGLEKTLIDMHQRPRSYAESGHGLVMRSNDHLSEVQQLAGDSSHNPGGNLDNARERSTDKQVPNEQSAGLRLGSAREPFSREHFERQMRQTNSVSKDRLYLKKDDEKSRTGMVDPSYPATSQQSELDNEASKIFSQSFQKDFPRSNSSPRGLTVSTLIDVFITKTINQNNDTDSSSKSDIDFSQYIAGYDDKPPSKPVAPKNNPRAEIVTIDDEPETERNSNPWSERVNRHTPTPTSTSSAPYSSDKVSLNDHIAAIISKDYNSRPEGPHAPHFTSSSSTPSTPAVRTSSPYVPSSSTTSVSAKSQPSLLPVSPPEANSVNSNMPHSMPDHSQTNWKLRRALQQDRDAGHRSPRLNESSYKRPSSNQSSDSSLPPEERQIIRVAQTSSPSSQSRTRGSPAGPYGVEPISPPTQSAENDSASKTPHTQAPPAWAANPSISGLLTTRHAYPQEYAESVPPAAVSHYNPPAPSGNSPPRNRPSPHQQQISLSPLDYMTNRIVEAMRAASTATDAESEQLESRRPQSAMSHSDDRDHQAQPMYRYQQGPEREMAERPCSNGTPSHPGPRYSPAMTRYSPVPPRPSSAVERVPSRNSTPGSIHKRGSDVVGDWRENQSASSRASSRSASPSVSDHPDNVLRRKTRTEGTFIPESTTDRAPVLMPQNSVGIHRSGSMSEAPRLSSNNGNAMENQSPKIMYNQHNDAYHRPPENDAYKYRTAESRAETQWNLMNSHSSSRNAENDVMARSNDSAGVPSSTTPEGYSAATRNDLQKHADAAGTRRSPLTNSISPEAASRNSPSVGSQPQKGAPPPASAALYSSFGASNGTGSGMMYSSAGQLPPPANPHVAYPYSAYPYSALSMRSMATPNSAPMNNPPPTTSPYAPGMPMNTPAARNSPSPRPPRSNSNQPPPLMSSQYEPLSDED